MTMEYQTKPTKIAFLLLDNFTMLSLSSAIDPLRMANQLTSRELYQWPTFSETGQSVRSSDGLSVSADYSINDIDNVDFDTLIVAGGSDITRSYTQNQLNALKRVNQKGIQLGGICTGSYALAAAGLLDGYDCSAHWECLNSIAENFPKVNKNDHLYSISEHRLTSSGGLVPLDMMLTFIKRQHGQELMAAISDMFLCDRVRGDNDYQRIPLSHSMSTMQPKLVELVSLMKNNIEEPLQLDELASYVNTSRRQLERLFQKNLNCTPSRYYLKLRLERARQLLKQTSLSVIEIATACGFVSTPHFSKCYRDYMGKPPREERYEAQGFKHQEKDVFEIEVASVRHESSTQSLTVALNEPSFGSIRLN